MFFELCCFILIYFIIFTIPIILLAIMITYGLPMLIVLLYLYLLIFESNVYNIPELIENNLSNTFYTLFLFILYLLYISACQI